MGYVFISYSSENQQMADSFKMLLNQNGIETWMAPGDVPFGSSYTASINRAIKYSSCFMLLFSESAQNSQWVPKETERAVSSGKTIFTVLLDDVLMNDSFEFMLSTSQAVAIRKIDENDEKIKQLLKAMKVLTDEIEENLNKDLNKDSTKSETVKSSEQQPDVSTEENQSSDFVIEDGVLRRYIGKYDSVDVVIPEGIKTIGNYAFNGCENLKSVIIPDSVTTIEAYAFSGCTSLNSVIIPNGVTTVDMYAFNGCTGLDSVTIPNSVKTIGISAFEGCKNLVSIEIPNSVINVGTAAFEGCEKLTSVTIPGGMASIPNHAFAACDKLSSVIISEGVKSIGNCAFIDCHSLMSVVIPNSVLDISEHAFGDYTTIVRKTNSDNDNRFNETHLYSDISSTCQHACITDLHNSKSSEQATVVRSEEINQSSGFVIKDCVLKMYTGTAKTVDIPAGVTSIEMRAFKNCKSLISVTIPNTVVSIRSHAFASCENLTSIAIPDSVKSIGDGVFSGCDNLETIRVSYDNKKYSSVNGVLYNKRQTILIKYPEGKNETSYIIPDGVTYIKNYAFKDCKNLTSVTIPSGVTSIESGAFWNCENLTFVTIPNSVTYIGDDTFRYCKNLGSILIPDSVTFIGAGAISLSEDAYVTCSEDSYAYKYCKEVGLRNLPDLKKERMSKKVCQHCGGKFSGLFKKKCIICEKEKDY